MIDGGVCLIVLVAALTGAVKGIGDTVLRIAAVIGGGALAFFYSDKVGKWFSSTNMYTTLHDHIFKIIRGGELGEQGDYIDGSADISDLLAGKENSVTEFLSKSLSGLFNSAADRAADKAAEKLTTIATGVISFTLIILAVSLAVWLLRAIIRSARKNSFALGVTDRLLGFVLGGVRGLMLAWIAIALLIPVTTIVSPDNVPAMFAALKATTISRVIYDVNPLLYVVKLVLRQA